MTPYHFSMTVSPDGTTHAYVLHRGVFVASRTFAKGELNELPQWLADASIWTRDLAQCTMNAAISYDHHDGMVHLSTAIGLDERFDPLSEESMAKLVRHLKRRAPIPEAKWMPGDKGIHQPLLPLPIPTVAEMAARTIYSNVGIADGAGRYRSPQPRYNKSAVSREKSQEIAKSILSDLFDL